tara:strand:+ start:1029 stop:1700 length:672 start_codon:yes stop_codon:yes gene_type:complete
MKQSRSASKNPSKNTSIYIKSLLCQKITLDFNKINGDLYNTFEKIIKKKVECKCINEGYVKNDSVKIISYSTGELFAEKVVFDVIFECLITNPVESMTFDCVVKSITKVGIRAELAEKISPFIIFVARDHHYNNELFSKVQENDIINVRIIGQRYELNDNFISVIAELLSINKHETLKTDLESKIDVGSGPNPINDNDAIKMKIKVRKQSTKTNKPKLIIEDL